MTDDAAAAAASGHGDEMHPAQRDEEQQARQQEAEAAAATSAEQQRRQDASGDDAEEGEDAAEAGTGQGATAISTRCKLYRLSGSHWDAIGVGHAAVELRAETPGGGLLMVVDEEDMSTLLVQHVLEAGCLQNYTRQQDTLILFSNKNAGDAGDDCGLSFESKEGCQVVWDALVLALNGGVPPSLSGGPMDEVLSLTLPPPTLASLPDLANTLDSLLSDPTERNSTLKDKTAMSLIGESYIEALFAVFKEAEAAEDIPALHCLWRVFKNFFLLNSTELTRELLLFNNILRVIACFEYNPYRPSEKLGHRKFLEGTVFRNPLELNKDIEERIKLLYYIQYFRETVAASVLDDAAYELLNTVLVDSRVSVLRVVACDEQHMDSLFHNLVSPDASAEVRETLLLFTEEMIVAAKCFPPQHRNVFFEFVVSRGALDAFIPFISAEASEKCRAAASNAVWQIAKYNVNFIRTACLAAPELEAGCPFLRAVFEQILRENVEGLQHHWQDIVKLILRTQSSSEQMPNIAPIQEMPPGFINLIYKPLPLEAAPEKQHPALVTLLAQPILKHPRNRPAPTEGGSSVAAADDAWGSFFGAGDGRRADKAAEAVLPLLSCCVTGHTVRMCSFLLEEALPRKICALLATGCPPQLALAILSFLSTLVACKDEMVYRNIVQHRLLQPVFDRLEGCSRYTLINSSCLNLVASIARSECRTLTRHVRECYLHVLQAPHYATVAELFTDQPKASKRPFAPESFAHPFSPSLQEFEGAYFEGEDDDDANDPMADSDDASEDEPAPKRLRREEA
eukprot:Rhum_TRINITY_DN7156_c0_g1::Rhum_TRINITY_DN7156_c0_g1_i1::g.21940::m.21940/K17491/SMEK, PPP4R3; protein phosphatase 4 regulatory subunit 3